MSHGHQQTRAPRQPPPHGGLGPPRAAGASAARAGSRAPEEGTSCPWEGLGVRALEPPIPVHLQMRPPRPAEGDRLAQGHTAHEGPSEDGTLGCLPACHHTEATPPRGPRREGSPPHAHLRPLGTRSAHTRLAPHSPKSWPWGGGWWTEAMSGERSAGDLAVIETRARLTVGPGSLHKAHCPHLSPGPDDPCGRHGASHWPFGSTHSLIHSLLHSFMQQVRAGHPACPGPGDGGGTEIPVLATARR